MTPRQIVCVQGLGFVGSAMALAVADARDGQGLPCCDVIGVDLPTDKGCRAVERLNAGRFPFQTTDRRIDQAVARAHDAGNLTATTDSETFRHADVVVVDVDFDLGPAAPGGDNTLEFGPLLRAIRTLGERIRSNCLVLIETTVPPGTCANVIAPALRACFAARGLSPDDVLLAHSYERVMPGENYLESITHFWRVYAGLTAAAEAACETFLRSVIDTQAYPLTRLATLTASETAKVLENSYRAVNIAFMQEWGRFAERVGVDLHEVVDAIRCRPTHNNIRSPGFGVGGYCLTKDPLFAPTAASVLFGQHDLDFPFSRMAVAVNEAMPLGTVAMLGEMLNGKYAGKTILLCGVAYRSGVGDTRRSPSETFARAVQNRGAIVVCHDPLVEHWDEVGLPVHRALPRASTIDALVFAVAHPEYRLLDVAAWLGGHTVVMIDANNVLTAAQRASIAATGCLVRSIGRGEATVEAAAV